MGKARIYKKQEPDEFYKHGEFHEYPVVCIRAENNKQAKEIAEIIANEFGNEIKV